MIFGPGLITFIVCVYEEITAKQLVKSSIQWYPAKQPFCETAKIMIHLTAISDTGHLTQRPTKSRLK